MWRRKATRTPRKITPLQALALVLALVLGSVIGMRKVAAGDARGALPIAVGSGGGNAEPAPRASGVGAGPKAALNHKTDAGAPDAAALRPDRCPDTRAFCLGAADDVGDPEHAGEYP